MLIVVFTRERADPADPARPTQRELLVGQWGPMGPRALRGSNSSSYTTRERWF